MKTSLSYILFIFLVIASLHTTAQEMGTLFIEVGFLRSDDGLVAVAIHSGEDGFPGSEETVVQSTYVLIKEGKAFIEFKNLPFGEYAVSAYHDENANKDLDTNWIGIPKEGVGASNNAKGKMGPPKYKDAKFEFLNDGQEIKFDMDYF